MRVIEALVKALTSAGVFNPEAQAAPACILWPDRDRQWEPAILRLQNELPEVFVLGDYSPEKRIGPAIWLRCVIPRKLPDVSLSEDRTPILYLPGISRQDLRAVETCSEYLKPLAELQYRGVFWSQSNAKDWTILAFLKSDQGGLGLDLAQDNDTKNSMQLALSRLLDEEVELLKGKHLNKDYFNTLLTGGDPVKDVLQWLDQGEAFKAGRSTTEWKAFIEVCKSQLAFNPQKEGLLTGAAKLAAHEGPWLSVWKRFCEAPKLYPNIPAQIRKCKPPSDSIFWLSSGGSFDGWPQWNEDQEKTLRNEMLSLKNMPPHEARNRIEKLEKTHGGRRQLVWAELGEAALSGALKHLAIVAETTSNALAAGSSDDLSAGYRAWAWNADNSVVQALADSNSIDDFEVVKTAIRSTYLPWLEESGRYFQKVAQERGYPGSPIDLSKTPIWNDGECALFVDGLRFDAAKRLEKLLSAKGLAVIDKPVWAALPTVTATGKPAATPVKDKISGQDLNADFEPCLTETGQSLKGGYPLKKLLVEAGWTILGPSEKGTGRGNAWCECGNIDHEGHDKGWKLAKHLESILVEIRDRIIELLSSGWKTVHVVTDHGWLLMPGGLPKSDLPKVLTENKWGRCAAIKPGASTDEPMFPWYWNPNLHFALADGVSCYKKGLEYTHGGLSLQECLTLELIVSAGKPKSSDQIEITDVVWKGLRCTVGVEGKFSGLSLDIRTQPGNPSSSVVLTVKPFKDNETASVVVVNEDMSGSEATIVLLGPEAEPVRQVPTIIGGGNS